MNISTEELAKVIRNSVLESVRANRSVSEEQFWFMEDWETHAAKAVKQALGIVEEPKIFGQRVTILNPVSSLTDTQWLYDGEGWISAYSTSTMSWDYLLSLGERVKLGWGEEDESD